MSDDSGAPLLLIGQLQGGFREIKQMLVDQNAQHVRDGAEARADRERRHEENKVAIAKLSDSIDGTAVIARENKTWIDTKGKPMEEKVGKIDTRVTAIETDDLVKRSKAAGASMVWGGLAALITTGVMILGGLIALKNGGLAGLAEFLNHG